MAAGEIDVEANELERLRAENAALKQQVAVAERVSASRSAKARNGFAAALMLVATFALALAIPAVWVNRMVTSTDYYVQTVSPLAQDPAIQDVVAAAASDAAIEQLDLKTRLESQLPTNLAFLAAPINSAAEGFIRKQATTFVRSDAFPQIWDKINTVGHKAFVTAVTGKQTGAVQIDAGTVTLDVGELTDQIVAKLDGAGFGLINKLPASATDRTITLYQSDALAQASVAVDQVQNIALVLPLLGIALCAGAVGLAANRRRALLWLGWSMLAWTLIPLQVIYIGQSYVGQQLQSLASIPSDAAQNAYGIIFAALINMERLFVGMSLLVILAALLAGPSKWAVALRRGMSTGISGVSSHLDLGVFGEWVAARMAALRVTGYLIAAGLLLVLPRPRTMTQVWWIAAFVVLWVFAVQLAGSGAAADAEASDAPVEPPAEAALASQGDDAEDGSADDADPTEAVATDSDSDTSANGS